MSRLIVSKSIKHQERIVDKAKKLVKDFSCGTQQYKELVNNGFFAISVSYRYRLLSKDKGRNWFLMTHEQYNRYY